MRMYIWTKLIEIPLTVNSEAYTEDLGQDNNAPVQLHKIKICQRLLTFSFYGLKVDLN